MEKKRFISKNSPSAKLPSLLIKKDYRLGGAVLTQKV
jgi:hypothetical protein